jgi:hypothetical protein
VPPDLIKLSTGVQRADEQALSLTELHVRDRPPAGVLSIHNTIP